MEPIAIRENRLFKLLRLMKKVNAIILFKINYIRSQRNSISIIICSLICNSLSLSLSLSLLLCILSILPRNIPVSLPVSPFLSQSLSLFLSLEHIFMHVSNPYYLEPRRWRSGLERSTGKRKVECLNPTNRKPRQTLVVKTGSDSSPAKRWALTVSVTGPLR